jgi:hypothetical protein
VRVHVSVRERMRPCMLLRLHHVFVPVPLPVFVTMNLCAFACAPLPVDVCLRRPVRVGRKGEYAAQADDRRPHIFFLPLDRFKAASVILNQ